MGTADKASSPAPWAAAPVRFLLGELTLEDWEKAARAAVRWERPLSLCRFHFYAGMIVWVRGDEGRARTELEQCIGPFQPKCFEQAAAGAILAGPR